LVSGLRSSFSDDISRGAFETSCDKTLLIVVHQLGLGAWDWYRHDAMMPYRNLISWRSI
jgi:hypothetical protein